MYITINKIRYPCTGYAPRDGTVIFSGVKGLELPVQGTVTLCADDGFELSVQQAGDYARQTLMGGVLTLTNNPEPEPVPEPEPEFAMTIEEAILDKLTELEYRQDLAALGLEGGMV